MSQLTPCRRLQNCLEMERFLEREPATSVIDDAQCLSAAAAEDWAARSLVLRPERLRIRRHSSCADDDETVEDARPLRSSDTTRLTAVSTGFDSDSGCGTSEPSSPDAAVAAASSRADAGSGVVVVMACRCSASRSRRCWPPTSDSAPVVDDIDGAATTDTGELVASRAHRCSFQGCRKMYTKRSHLKSHLRTHTGQWYTDEKQTYVNILK